MRKNSIFTIGLDLGDRISHLCVLDSQGEVVREGRMTTSRDEFERFFGQIGACVVAFEVGTHSRWTDEVIRACGHETLIANPHQVKLVYGSYKKTDRTDAEMLARVARADPKLLCPVEHRGRQSQEILARVRSRDVLVRSRTAMINSVRGQVKAQGSRLPTCSSESFVRRCESHIPESLAKALLPLLDVIRNINREIDTLDKQLEAKGQEHDMIISRLSQIAGVGVLTAMTFMAVVEDPKRFPRRRDIGSYLGLCEKRDDSGQIKKQLRITKRGDGYLRKLLVNCAHYVMHRGPDTDLKRWGLLLRVRGGQNGKKRAVVAVARKLAVLLLTLWQKETDYVPLRNSAPPLSAEAVSAGREGVTDAGPSVVAPKTTWKKEPKAGPKPTKKTVDVREPKASPPPKQGAVKICTGQPNKGAPRRGPGARRVSSVELLDAMALARALATPPPMGGA